MGAASCFLLSGNAFFSIFLSAFLSTAAGGAGLSTVALLEEGRAVGTIGRPPPIGCLTDPVTRDMRLREKTKKGDPVTSFRGTFILTHDLSRSRFKLDFKFWRAVELTWGSFQTDTSMTAQFVQRRAEHYELRRIETLREVRAAFESDQRADVD